jgi:hypothetical protein
MMTSIGQKTHSTAEPEWPDELLAMIQFEGTPALQQALCREFIVKATCTKLIVSLSRCNPKIGAKILISSVTQIFQIWNHIKSEECTSSGDALKVSNVGGGEEAFHEVLRHAMNEARNFVNLQ